MNPLQGLKVLEFEGLAPSIHVSTTLKHFGAEVTLVSNSASDNFMHKGKQVIALSPFKKQD